MVTEAKSRELSKAELLMKAELEKKIRYYSRAEAVFASRLEELRVEGEELAGKLLSVRGELKFAHESLETLLVSGVGPA